MKKIDEVTVIQEDECVTEAKNAFLSVALIVGILTIIVGICVAVYKYLTPDYLDDFDDYDDHVWIHIPLMMNVDHVVLFYHHHPYPYIFFLDYIDIDSILTYHHCHYNMHPKSHQFLFYRKYYMLLLF